MSAYEFIKTETEGRLFIVTINRPDQLNCLHPMGNAEMGAAFDEFAKNPDLWVAIVTGAGRKGVLRGQRPEIRGLRPEIAGADALVGIRRADVAV